MTSSTKQDILDLIGGTSVLKASYITELLESIAECNDIFDIHLAILDVVTVYNVAWQFNNVDAVLENIGSTDIYMVLTEILAELDMMMQKYTESIKEVNVVKIQNKILQSVIYINKIYDWTDKD